MDEDLAEKILALDPTEIISRVKIDNFVRKPWISIGKLFPNDGKTCACGCGTVLTGRRTRWASSKCQSIPIAVYFILRGDVNTIFRVLRHRDGDKCKECGRSSSEIYEQDLRPDPKYKGNRELEVEHILPVHKGGGGLWLHNYQLLCGKCHKIKTRQDKTKNQ